MKTRNYLILLFVLFLNQGFGQELYTLSGRIEQTSSYQGGAPLPFDYFMPTPKINFEMVVVRIVDPKEAPVKVGTIRTDSTGRFSIVLPAGDYGFVMPYQLDSLKPGETLPRGSQYETAHEYFSQSWSLSLGGINFLEPSSQALTHVSITNKDVSNVYIHQVSHSGCMDCP